MRFTPSILNRTMSTVSVANLQRISAKNLSALLLAEQAAAAEPTIAVVDVRGDGKTLSLPFRLTCPATDVTSFT